MNNKGKEKFIEESIKKFGEGKFDYSQVEYVNTHTKVILICSKHGPFEITPHNHLRSKTGCRKCGYEQARNKNAKTKEQFIIDSRKIHKNKYDYDKVEYVNAATKVIITCPFHGDFLQAPSEHLKGQGCSKCSESHGEREISNLLTEFEIPFIREYQIPIDTSINPSGIARIDFYLPDSNTFIEYNGRQHYYDELKRARSLENQQKRDEAVRDYCIKNNIKLIEIAYNESIINLLINNNIIKKG